MLYGYNLAVVNSPAEYIKAFYNHTWVMRNNTSPSKDSLILMYSLTVSVFAIGGLIGSLLVGTLVTRLGRKGTLVNSTLLVFASGILMGFSRICSSPEMVIIGRLITGIHSGHLLASSKTLSFLPLPTTAIKWREVAPFISTWMCSKCALAIFSIHTPGVHASLPTSTSGCGGSTKVQGSQGIWVPPGSEHGPLQG
ncbi:GTR5 protein, partial [Polypterus senegalus]